MQTVSSYEKEAFRSIENVSKQIIGFYRSSSSQTKLRERLIRIMTLFDQSVISHCTSQVEFMLIKKYREALLLEAKEQLENDSEEDSFQYQ